MQGFGSATLQYCAAEHGQMGSIGCGGAYCCLQIMLRAKQSITQWHERHSTKARRISYTAANCDHFAVEYSEQCLC